MGLFALSKRIAAKKIGDLTGSKPAAPAGSQLPLNARIGGLLEVMRADFAVLSNTLVKTPHASQEPIVAISRVKLDADPNLRMHRLYTNTGKNRKGEGAAFLQILTQADDPKTLIDVAYYQFLTRQYPAAEEEQAAYQGNGFGLGERAYFMADDQLTTIGIAPDTIKTLLGDADSLEFTRDTPTAEDYFAPFQGVETRLDDAAGDHGLQKKLWFVPYTRPLVGSDHTGTERLLISFEVLNTMDGEDMRAVQLDFLIGLELDPARVRVI